MQQEALHHIHHDTQLGTLLQAHTVQQQKCFYMCLFQQVASGKHQDVGAGAGAKKNDALAAALGMQV